MDAIGFLCSQNRRRKVFVIVFGIDIETIFMISHFNDNAELKDFNQQKRNDELSQQYDNYLKLTGKFLEIKTYRQHWRESNKATGETVKH